MILHIYTKKNRIAKAIHIHTHIVGNANSLKHAQIYWYRYFAQKKKETNMHLSVFFITSILRKKK
jgi:hypothetical protein